MTGGVFQLMFGHIKSFTTLNVPVEGDIGKHCQLESSEGLPTMRFIRHSLRF